MISGGARFHSLAESTLKLYFEFANLDVSSNVLVGIKYNGRNVKAILLCNMNGDTKKFKGRIFKLRLYVLSLILAFKVLEN